MFYRIVSKSDTKNKIYVSPGFDRKPFNGLEKVSIAAGHKREHVDIIIDENIGKDEIVISSNVVNSLNIPCDILYQARNDKGEIRLGPVIGLLMAREGRRLRKKMLNNLLYYTLQYNNIKGLLIVFSIDGIDFNANLVHGYYYGPEDSRNKMIWKEGTFPFPDSIFRRVVVSDPMRLKLKEKTSNRMFNSYYFDKWEFWNMMKESGLTDNCIPYTRLYSSINDVDFMLEHFNSAYLKPIDGTLARGVIKVTETDGNYVFQSNTTSNKIYYSSKSEASRYLEAAVKGHKYLIQQALKPMAVNGRHTDFRVIMQKNQTQKWVCTGIITCMGKLGNIDSNWGIQLTFDDFFIKYFNYSQEDIFRKKQEVVTLCKAVCNQLDSYGENYGDLGIDVVIDENQKVWILEANKKHYHTVPLWINDVQTFYDVKTNPIKYATSLSGFSIN